MSPTKRSIIYNVPENDFINYVAKSQTWRELAIKCGYRNQGNNKVIRKRISELKLNTDHLPRKGRDWSKGRHVRKLQKYTLEDILVENSTYYSMTSLRRRLHSELGWKNRCSSCLLEKWMGKPIPLEMDHINGTNNDNRITNLRLLCPNCHAFTDTYRGKNVKYQTKPKTCIDCDIQISRSSTRCEPCNLDHRYGKKTNNKITIEDIVGDAF